MNESSIHAGYRPPCPSPPTRGRATILPRGHLVRAGSAPAMADVLTSIIASRRDERATLNTSSYNLLFLADPTTAAGGGVSGGAPSSMGARVRRAISPLSAGRHRQLPAILNDGGGISRVPTTRRSAWQVSTIPSSARFRCPHAVGPAAAERHPSNGRWSAPRWRSGPGQRGNYHFQALPAGGSVTMRYGPDLQRVYLQRYGRVQQFHRFPRL